MRIDRIWEMPNKYTFKMRCVDRLLKEEVNGFWIDPFAGKYSCAQSRNDMDKSMDTQYHIDGLEYLKMFEFKNIDGIIFDPPYSVRQALENYKPRYKGTAGRTEYRSVCKNQIAKNLKPGGKVICFGWDSTGCGKKRGFTLERVLLICHGGAHYDTIVTVETKNQIMI